MSKNCHTCNKVGFHWILAWEIKWLISISGYQSLKSRTGANTIKHWAFFIVPARVRICNTHRSTIGQKSRPPTKKNYNSSSRTLQASGPEPTPSRGPDAKSGGGKKIACPEKKIQQICFKSAAEFTAKVSNNNFFFFWQQLDLQLELWGQVFKACARSYKRNSDHCSKFWLNCSSLIGWGRRSTEVAFVLHTQPARDRISAFPIFFRNFLMLINEI